jgi:hypothetical protein
LERGQGVRLSLPLLRRGLGGGFQNRIFNLLIIRYLYNNLQVEIWNFLIGLTL